MLKTIPVTYSQSGCNRAFALPSEILSELFRQIYQTEAPKSKFWLHHWTLLSISYGNLNIFWKFWGRHAWSQRRVMKVKKQKLNSSSDFFQHEGKNNILVKNNILRKQKQKLKTFRGRSLSRFQQLSNRNAPLIFLFFTHSHTRTHLLSLWKQLSLTYTRCPSEITDTHTLSYSHSFLPISVRSLSAKMSIKKS